jgi:3-phosphoshikimate 1-carboxyvinyltransferase
VQTISVPGDKSISHRALMLAPLAHGTSRITGCAPGADVASTAEAMKSLGVEIREVGDSGLEIDGPVRLVSPAAPIDCGNSGTTARLLTGLIAGQPITATLDGDESLRRRPMGRVVEPLRAAGAAIEERGEPGRLPLAVSGGGLRAIRYELPVAGAQLKSALLFAGLGGSVPVAVFEPGHSRDHTERMLLAMGAPLKMEEVGNGRRLRLDLPERPLRPLSLHVPGDFSSAAFWIALAVLGGCGSGARLTGVGLNPGRTGFLRVLKAMGARIHTTSAGESAGEPVGDIEAGPLEVKGLKLPAEWMPELLDEIPIIACIASRAVGITVIRGASELRLKESDRIATLCSNMSALGVKCVELDDGMEIVGSGAPRSGRVRTEGDHRIAMAFAILGTLPGNDIEIDDRACVDVSYPGFWERLAEI